MNRSLKEHAAALRIFPAGSQHRRAKSLTGIRRESDENLDLFSMSRRSVSLASSHESDVALKLGKISVGSAKVARSGLEDLLASNDGGKHDYDWLLTPPETPLFPSSVGNECQPTIAVPKSGTFVRAGSTTKASTPSVKHFESNLSSRPARSSSLTRSSISSTQNSSYFSSRSSSILNTSSASVSSYIRPSSSITRSPSSARPSSPSPRTTTSRPSTPSKSRSSPTLSSTDKPRASQSSRPSTPTSRSHVPSNLTSQGSLSNSRPSTPARRNTTPMSSAASNLVASTMHVLPNGRNQTSASRPSSPSPRVLSKQPVIPPDFPLDAPPNLRTTLPDRPVSAGRSRPAKVNIESQGSVNFPRRPSSPTPVRGLYVEPHGRGRLHANGHIVDIPEPRKSSVVPESPIRKTAKASTGSESTGFGRSISKKSLDMAIRHMDIRNGPGSMRPLPGTVLYPQSIRSAAPKNQPVRASCTQTFTESNGNLSSENGKYANGSLENCNKEESSQLLGKVNAVDIFESSRYDAILLKEDLKNTNWLHSMDDKSDQGPIFDNGFEPLPEPFNLS
ncbi:hypothetical protein Nepgr_011896 [Nepenthes gracilis]|uniref:Uncharacterized protein n=1 Tax=Nepenthes gracilis TaxID=150966 RepID=A0AAD3SEW5_NEPGR|nr:hypothetical protein Nepgr_011896 [Nepenthes gracilis]